MRLTRTNNTRAHRAPLARLMVAATLALAMCAAAQARQSPAASSPTSTPPAPQAAPPAPINTPETPLQSAPSAQTPFSPLTLDQALRLALTQASAFAQARLSERIAAEDVRQARAAFLPQVFAAPSLIYTSPAIGARDSAGAPRAPSFIGANALTEYQGLVNVSGELDTAGRLRATLRRNMALLEAARAGSETARLTLVEATEEAYYGLALAAERRDAAERNVVAAAEFERTTALLVGGGEAAPVDRTRAGLQTTARRDELEQARAAEAAAADALRALVGYAFTQPIATEAILTAAPETGEIERLTADAIARRPELAEFAAEARAARAEAQAARAERRPQLTYALSGGFVSDSLRPPKLREHTGVSATVGVSVPLLDWGASRSRARQAEWRAQAAESARAVAERSFAQQFYTARAQALTAAARVRLNGAGIPDAERNLAASLARYRAGEAQILEVTEAQNTLIAQRTALYQAIYDYRVARARLRQATGQ